MELLPSIQGRGSNVNKYRQVQACLLKMIWLLIYLYTHILTSLPSSCLLVFIFAQWCMTVVCIISFQHSLLCMFASSLCQDCGMDSLSSMIDVPLWCYLAAVVIILGYWWVSITWQSWGSVKVIVLIRNTPQTWAEGCFCLNEGTDCNLDNIVFHLHIYNFWYCAILGWWFLQLRNVAALLLLLSACISKFSQACISKFSQGSFI